MVYVTCSFGFFDLIGSAFGLFKGYVHLEKVEWMVPKHLKILNPLALGGSKMDGVFERCHGSLVSSEGLSIPVD